MRIPIPNSIRIAVFFPIPASLCMVQEHERPTFQTTVFGTYFQGPRYHLMLILEVQRPGAKRFQVFNTDDFKRPSD